MSTAALRNLVRRYFRAYQSKDRKVVEELLSDDFTFTSPGDDHISKAEYFERCWPNSQKVRAFHIERIFDHRDEAFVRYTAERVSDGVKFQNTERMCFKSGKIKEVDVYFGPEGVGQPPERRLVGSWAVC